MHSAHQCRNALGDGRQEPRVPEIFFDAVVAQYVITAVPDPEGRSTISSACSSLAAN